MFLFCSGENCKRNKPPRPRHTRIIKKCEILPIRLVIDALIQDDKLVLLSLHWTSAGKLYKEANDYSRMESERALIVFQGKNIRRIWYTEEWFFSVVDIIAILTEQEDHLRARKYWNKLRQRLGEEGSEVVTDCHRLKMRAPDGKMRLTDCANTMSLLRIIQTIPSKKAEPLKLWLAQVGHDRIQEIENPELAQKRMKETYLRGIHKIGLKNESGALQFVMN